MKPEEFPEALKLKDDKFITCIGNIRLKAEKIFADSLLPHYTRHDVKHSETIIKRIGELLEDHPRKLKEQERFILIAAAYLHDIGMQYPTYSGLPLKGSYTVTELEKVRNNHHEASNKIILNSIRMDADPKLGLDELAYYVDSIAEVARYHRKLDLNKLKDTCVHDGEVRQKLLASLLRLGDALDLDNERVIVEKLKQREISAKSKFHWWGHLLVRAVNARKLKIEIFLLNLNYNKEIFDELFKELRKSIETPFYDTYDILDGYNLRLYQKPIFTKDANFSALIINVPEDLQQYIREEKIGLIEKDAMDLIRENDVFDAYDHIRQNVRNYLIAAIKR